MQIHRIMYKHTVYHHVSIYGDNITYYIICIYDIYYNVVFIRLFIIYK